ncbi:hypothetical protein TKK_0016036 [Trichogramma kaykai]|uniref:Uncharacterized protein n=1 Tax=Trichogramma kaykai TaxID=54128 RepID=A0ABD2W9E6_9HYME
MRKRKLTVDSSGGKNGKNNKGSEQNAMVWNDTNVDSDDPALPHNRQKTKKFGKTLPPLEIKPALSDGILSPNLVTPPTPGLLEALDKFLPRTPIFADVYGNVKTDEVTKWIFSDHWNNETRLCQYFSTKPYDEVCNFVNDELRKRKVRTKCICCGNSLLHLSIRVGYDKVSMLLMSENLIHCKNDLGETPLHTACDVGSLEIVDELIENGADPSAKDNSGIAPVYIALAKGHSEMVDFFIQNGIDVNQPLSQFYKIMPLHVAALKGFSYIVSMLLHYGADPEAQTKQGHSAVSIAIVSNHTECAKQILTTIPDLNVDLRHINNQTLLHLSCQYDREECVKMLLLLGADIHLQDENGMTALHIVAHKNHLNLMQILLSYGCNVNVTDKWNRTPLYSAVMSNHASMVKMLLTYGANTDSIGMALHKALKNNQRQVVMLLLNHGVDVQSRDLVGNTLLQTAVKQGDVEITRQLLRLGADVSLIGGINSLMPDAISSKNPQLVALLCDAGADVDNPNEDGTTPIERAMLIGNHEILDILLRYTKNSDQKIKSRKASQDRDNPLEYHADELKQLWEKFRYE